MNKAHVFQHNYTGVQMFVYHCIDETQARVQLGSVVFTSSNWTYLGLKTAIDCNE